jgi:hypothetical protein
VMAAATSPDLISTVTLTFNMAIIEKGPAVVDSETFDLGRHHVSRGHRWEPIL